jgi:hypothetical protein
MTPNRCLYCGRWYAMAPRLYLRQKTCGDEQCRSKHKAALNRKWRKEHPDEQKERDKAVAKRRKGQRYWDQRRSKDPDYVERNREQTRERMRQMRAARKEAGLILKEPVRYLEELGSRGAEMFATQESIWAPDRRWEGARPRMFATQESIGGLSVGLWTYLKVRAMFATREGIAPVEGAGV